MAFLDLNGLRRFKNKLDEKYSSPIEAIRSWRPSGNGRSGQILRSNGDGTTSWQDAATSQDVAQAVDNWMDDHISPNTAIALDDSLTSTTAAAQGAAAGNMVLVTDTQPSSNTNKVWIKKTPDSEIVIPTIDDHNQLMAYAQGKYAIPSGGIPSTDMASAVQTSLNKADTAYQKPSDGIPSTDLEDSYIEEPSSEGTQGQFLRTDGNGGRTWATPLSSDIKEALLDAFQHVAWVNGNGQNYYDALYEALYDTAPNPYVFYDYIQSDGSAFIDTGLDARVYGADTYSKEIKFVMTSFSRHSGDYPYVTGVTNSWGNTGFYVCGETSASDNTLYVLSNQQYDNTTITLSSRDEFVTIRTFGRDIYYNDTLIYTASRSTATINNEMTIPLFTIANYSNGNFSYKGYYVNNPCPVRIYEYTIKNSNGVTVAHIIPAKRKSDNAIGMYDTVRETFFTNANSTGAFTVGNDE